MPEASTACWYVVTWPRAVGLLDDAARGVVGVGHHGDTLGVDLPENTVGAVVGELPNLGAWVDDAGEVPQEVILELYGVAVLEGRSDRSDAAGHVVEESDLPSNGVGDVIDLARHRGE